MFLYTLQCLTFHIGAQLLVARAAADGPLGRVHFRGEEGQE